MRHRTTAALGLCSMVVVASAASGAYQVIDLGPIASPVTADAHAINQNGLAVGEFTTAAGTQGFSYFAGTKNTFGPVTGDTELFGVNSSGTAVGTDGSNGVIYGTAASSSSPTLTGSFGGPTVAHGINDTGLIVGSSQYPATVPYAFFQQGPAGTITPLTPPAQQSTSSTAIGAAGSVALAVNNNGTIVGQAAADSSEHAFVYTGGSMFDIGTLSGNAADVSTAYAVNAGGAIVGSSYDSNGNLQAFEFTNYTTDTATGMAVGTLTPLGFLDPGTATSEALGINNNGVIVGYSEDANGDNLAVEFTGSGPVALDSLIGSSPWTLEEAESVNDAGQIVGFGLLDGTQHAFLLQPSAVPEPASVGVILVCAAGLTRRRRAV